MQAEGRDEDQANEQDRHDHVKAASELSDRAAESVGRRYDATNEALDEAQRHDEDQTPDD
jgi:hypothetical protein